MMSLSSPTFKAVPSGGSPSIRLYPKPSPKGAVSFLGPQTNESPSCFAPYSLAFVKSAERIKFKGIEPKDLKTIQDYVGNCHYGLDIKRLLRPSSGFRVSCDRRGKKITLHNLKKKDSSLHHTCVELSINVGRLIQRKFGKKYIVEPLWGQGTDYFIRPRKDFHAFLGIWETKDNRKVQQALRKKPIRLPAECTLVDPSFRRIGTQEALGYSIEGLNTWTPSNAHTLRFDGSTIETPQGKLPMTTLAPLGYLRDFTSLPAALAKSLLFLGFIRDRQGRIIPQLVIQHDPTKAQTNRYTLKEGEASQRLLAEFMKKLERDLQAFNISIA